LLRWLDRDGAPQVVVRRVRGLERDHVAGGFDHAGRQQREASGVGARVDEGLPGPQQPAQDVRLPEVVKPRKYT